MDVAEILVTLGGAVAITLVLWFFLGPSRRSPRDEEGRALEDVDARSERPSVR